MPQKAERLGEGALRTMPDLGQAERRLGHTTSARKEEQKNALLSHALLALTLGAMLCLIFDSSGSDLSQNGYGKLSKHVLSAQFINV